ncbi:hypothetical protein CJ030_MR1G027726 [Morella rubra]|uniref:Uncharacterized protein n=1 Tax=Morella rubra TaxID=262757 RepID=A0A6A1WPG2_9ROSI|nr:hypothetical protein CJ030_MR1G027726 [Morella rubra]
MTLRQTLSKLLRQLIGGKKDRHQLLSVGEVGHVGTTSTLTTPSGGREDGGQDYDDGTSNHNRMHAYFKKFLSKEAALLKPYLIPRKNSGRSYAICSPAKHLCEQNKKNRSKLTVNHTAGSRSFQRTRACMKNQESGEINPAELYKKNYTNKDGIWTLEGVREIYEQMDALQCHCDLEGKTYTEIEIILSQEKSIHRLNELVRNLRAQLQQCRDNNGTTDDNVSPLTEHVIELERLQILGN